MGIGLENLMRTMEFISEGSYAYMIDTQDCIVTICGDFHEKDLLRNSLIDIYVSNRFLSFAEILKPLRNAVNLLEDVRRVSSRMLPPGYMNKREEEMKTVNQGIDYDLEANRSIPLDAKAIVWSGVDIEYVVLESFLMTPWKEINSLKYFLVGKRANGYFRPKVDLGKEMRFKLFQATGLSLENATLFSCEIEKSKPEKHSF
jgi:hypothetical protein